MEPAPEKIGRAPLLWWHTRTSCTSARTRAPPPGGRSAYDMRDAGRMFYAYSKKTSAAPGGYSGHDLREVDE